jgi:hypothetical protein
LAAGSGDELRVNAKTTPKMTSSPARAGTTMRQGLKLSCGSTMTSLKISASTTSAGSVLGLTTVISSLSSLAVSRGASFEPVGTTMRFVFRSEASVFVPDVATATGSSAAAVKSSANSPTV